MNKISSYLGFAKKSNNLIVGQSQIKRCTKQLYAIVVCTSASDNLKNLAKNVAQKFNCKVVEIEALEDQSKILDVKILGVTDENLGKAIIDNKEKT